jgi:hypothetical protein
VFRDWTNSSDSFRDRAGFAILQAAVASGLNALVAAGTQAGKTTMLNALCAAIPASDRVITAEEVFELQVPLPDVVSMQTRQANLEATAEITLRRLVKEVLRMRPNRIIVGDLRQEGCLDPLIALNSGFNTSQLPPSVATSGRETFGWAPASLSGTASWRSARRAFSAATATTAATRRSKAGGARSGCHIVMWVRCSIVSGGISAQP